MKLSMRLGAPALVCLFACLLGTTEPADAQSTVRPTPRVVASCGTPPYTYAVGDYQWSLIDQNGSECVNATVTATATVNGFTPSTSGARMTPLSVAITDTSGPLPTGTVDVISNAGATNPMYCNVNGVAATASDQEILPGSWFAFTIPSGVTTLHCIATGGTTTANGLGGSGLASGAGGGGSSGGGSSGAVFGPTAAGSAAANPPVLTGGTIDGSATGNVSVQKVVAGVASDNTAQVNGVTVLTGTGATGTGSPRDTVAQDTSTVAGAAPLTTGLYVTGPSAAALATSALQTTGNTSLGTIATNTTGASTAALQTTGNTSLGTIATASAAQATAANQPTNAAQNSTTSGQTGPLIQGAVTTASPTYTTAHTSPLSLDTTGALRVNVTAGGAGGGAVFGPTAVGSAAANPPILIGGTPTGSATGNVTLTAVKPPSTAPLATDPALVVAISPNSVNANGQTTMSASAPVTIASDQSAVAVGVTNSSGAHQAVIGCDNSAPYDASTNGSTQLVALSSGKTIYVCGYSIFAAGTVNVELDYGTGTACATGTAKIVPAFQLTTQVGAVDGSTFYRGLHTAASNELCLKTSAGVAVQGIVYFSQF